VHGYELTARRRRALGAEREQWRAFATVVDTVFEGEPWPGTTRSTPTSPCFAVLGRFLGLRPARR
jgi:hypothetical protein